MVVERNGKSQQALKQYMNLGCIEEILSPDDMCDALVGVVADNGQMVGGPHAGPCQRNIPYVFNHIFGHDPSFPAVRASAGFHELRN